MKIIECCDRFVDIDTSCAAAVYALTHSFQVASAPPSNNAVMLRNNSKFINFEVIHTVHF
jgi:hypothetical protein